MKEELITEIMQQMLPYLDNARTYSSIFVQGSHWIYCNCRSRSLHESGL